MSRRPGRKVLTDTSEADELSSTSEESFRESRSHKIRSHRDSRGGSSYRHSRKAVKNLHPMFPLNQVMKQETDVVKIVMKEEIEAVKIVIVKKKELENILKNL